MVNKTNYWKQATIGSIILLMASMGVNIAQVTNDEGYLPYTCENGQDLLCYKLSRVNDQGFQRYCYYDRDRPRSFKRCDTGWELTPPDNYQTTSECPEVQVIAYTDQGKYFCDGIGATANCIKDESVELPII